MTGKEEVPQKIHVARSEEYYTQQVAIEVFARRGVVRTEDLRESPGTEVLEEIVEEPQCQLETEKSSNCMPNRHQAQQQ